MGRSPLCCCMVGEITRLFWYTVFPSFVNRERDTQDVRDWRDLRITKYTSRDTSVFYYGRGLCARNDYEATALSVDVA